MVQGPEHAEWGGGTWVGLDEWHWDEQAAAEPRAEQTTHPKPRAEKPPPPPPRAKPKPAALPFTPDAWEYGDHCSKSDAAILRPKKKSATPATTTPIPKPTRAAKPAPIPPRGKHPYGDFPRAG